MIKNFSIFLLFILTACCEDRVEECPCYTDPQYPHYKGCPPGTIYDMSNDCSVQELYKQIYTVIKYPQEAIDDSIQGTVAVNFDIFKNGSMGNYSAINDTLGHGLANAAIEAVKTLDQNGFCPARENCEPVLYNFTLPVKFKLY